MYNRVLDKYLKKLAVTETNNIFKKCEKNVISFLITNELQAAPYTSNVSCSS